MEKPRYVETRRLADGSLNYVWNPSAALKRAGFQFKSLGTDQDAAFTAADVENTQVDKMRSIVRKDIIIYQGTVGGLVREYGTSKHFKALAASTQDSYLNTLNLLIETEVRARPGAALRRLGDFSLTEITPGLARKTYETVTNRRGIGAGKYAVAVAQALFNFARLEDMVAGDNPFNRLQVKGRAPRTTVWTEDQRNAFITKSDELGLWCVGTVALLCYEFSLRPGDVLRFVWDQFKDNQMSVQTQKRQVWVFQGISKEAQARLEMVPEAERVGWVSKHPKGWKWNKNTYGTLFRKVREAAGLPDELQVRDMRRTAATEMIDAGLTYEQLMAVGGWQDPASLRPYIAISKNRTKDALEKRWAYRDKLKEQEHGE